MAGFCGYWPIAGGGDGPASPAGCCACTGETERIAVIATRHARKALLTANVLSVIPALALDRLRRLDVSADAVPDNRYRNN